MCQIGAKLLSYPILNLTRGETCLRYGFFEFIIVLTETAINIEHHQKHRLEFSYQPSNEWNQKPSYPSHMRYQLYLLLG
jgi:hypothetical protein